MLFAASDSLFYFFPIMLGYTAGKNSAATLRHHGDRRRVDASVDDGGVRSGAAAGAVREYFFGIPLTFINYSSSVIPIIFAARVSCRPEPLFNRVIHSALRNFITPLLCRRSPCR